MDDIPQFKSGSVFWLIFIILSFSGLLYLGIWGFHNASARAIAISTIFSILMIFSIVVTKFEIFRLELDFFESCASFTMGFLLFIIIGGIIQVIQGGTFIYSIFSSLQLQKHSLFATISGQLPLFWDKYVNNFTIPVAEELFWLIALPISVFWILQSLSNIKGLKLLANVYIQLIIAFIISAGTFAIFHVGSVTLIAFVVAAIIFRLFLLFFVYSDIKFDLFPKLQLLYSFALGCHIGNNIAEEGLINFFVIMKTNLFGIFIILFLSLLVILGVIKIVDTILPGKWFTSNG